MILTLVRARLQGGGPEGQAAGFVSMMAMAMHEAQPFAVLHARAGVWCHQTRQPAPSSCKNDVYQGRWTVDCACSTALIVDEPACS
jgi:hypothetical protein